MNHIEWKRMFIDYDIKILIKKVNETLRDEKKSFKKFSMIIINIIEEEYQDSYWLINN